MIKFALYWVYGVVIPFTSWQDDGSTTVQALACKSEQRRGDVYQALHCVALGPPEGDCNGLLAMAKVDMPEYGIRACVSVKRADLGRLRR